MLYFGVRRINHWFLLTSQRLHMFGGTLFPSFQIRYFCCVLRFKLQLHRQQLVFCHVNLQNHRSYFILAFWLLLTFFTAYFDVFKSKMHTLYLPCLLGDNKKAIVTFLSFFRLSLKTLIVHFLLLRTPQEVYTLFPLLFFSF